MSIFQFFRLQVLSKLRSISIGRDLATFITLSILIFIAIVYFGYVAFFLDAIIKQGFQQDDAISFLNTYLIFLFASEFFYRFYLQKLPVAEIEHYLHLPIKRVKIIRFLLSRSFISLLNVFILLLLLPFAFKEVASVYGTISAWMWFLTISFISWALHWVMLLFKKKMGDRFTAIFCLFVIYLITFGAQYFGWFNIGLFFKPFFDASLVSIFPLLIAISLCVLLYFVAFQYFKKNAYTEEIAPGHSSSRIIATGAGFLSRFGKAGVYADLEWQLIIRHKKSRSYLIISVIFLLYGLLLYPGFESGMEGVGQTMSIFVGLFITGMFLMQYGQLFLSWNSANFDFYLLKKHGIKDLVKGKNLLFIISCVGFFLFSVPYVYFGWEILAAHFVTMLFNVGINLHIVAWIANWKPKPMDINKGAFLNYEGVGAAQFLIMIPLFGLPYLIYLPIASFNGHHAGLLTLGLIGLIGILFYKPLTRYTIKQITNNRYQISSSFRQEI